MKALNSLYLEQSIRKKLMLKEGDLTPKGQVPITDFTKARQIAADIYKAMTPEKPLSGSDLYLMSLLNQFYTQLIEKFFQMQGKINPDIQLSGLTALKKDQEWNQYLRSQNRAFPAAAPIPEKEIVLNSLKGKGLLDGQVLDGLILYLSNSNPACRHLNFLFSNSTLTPPVRETILDDLKRFIHRENLGTFFSIKDFGRTGKFDLVSMLLEPAEKYPDSLEQQLLFILKQWKGLIDLDESGILTALDFYKEEHTNRMGGPGPVEGVDFSWLECDFARFSQDSDWMPNIILLAKNAFVWLDQLSKKYGHPVESLQGIPDEELDDLAGRGITGLWLIGLWERSRASKTIKRICGNPEAEASAYSLNRYDIADVLGGWGALENLKYRCMQRGIRLASDMVPNHTGLDSDWVIHHPDYFLSRPDLPFPGYSFNGPNLSDNDRVGLYIEDGYYSRSDASVVFKRVDHQTGECRYVYHGNDGTTMPWNDTAQINFLEPHIREEVIQQILHVARHFPIIRFDAAMTLATKHIKRLWFPEPGKGGAIPSRSEYAMSDAELRKKIPVEFWREVVDRIAEELPDTLLLAEAFWMMEGYFVRNLGMHRVYNSAFMNLLKTEDNHEFRKILKETMNYDPKIMKRYVNFMNNPDEDTAVAQFGKGDKYFGVCTLMMTLPGLPMVGHGQFEGYEEKYGMEYKKAYKDETPDKELLERHYREIVPLMKKRILFAGAKSFYFFDFIDGYGNINENVYAFCNAWDDQQALVLYNNSYSAAEGTVNQDVPKAINNDSGERIGSQSLSIREILGLKENEYTLLYDTKERLWYIRRSSELIRNGFYASLCSYQSRVYHPIQQRMDDENHSLEKLIQRYGSRGIPNLEKAIKFSDLEPAIHVLQLFFRNGIIDSSEMTDLITILSTDLGKIRKVMNRKTADRPDRKNTRNRKRMEALIIPAMEAFQMTEMTEDLLFQMVRFYESYMIWSKEEKNGDFRDLFLRLLKDPDNYEWFGINEYKNKLWYNQEKMEEAVWWFTIAGAVKFIGPQTSESFIAGMEKYEDFLTDLQNALAGSEYQIQKVITYLETGK